MFKKLECETGWTKFTIDITERCLKSLGRYRLDEATTICNRFNAKVPLPKNKQQDTDVHYKMNGKWNDNGGSFKENIV